MGVDIEEPECRKGEKGSAANSASSRCQLMRPLFEMDRLQQQLRWTEPATHPNTHTLGPATISCWWGGARPPSDRPSCPPTRHQMRTPQHQEPKLMACSTAGYRVKGVGV